MFPGLSRDRLRRRFAVSVQRYVTADGTRWRVRWREPSGRMRSTTVPSKRDAVALDADLKARKFKGEALPQPGRDTLARAQSSPPPPIGKRKRSHISGSFRVSLDLTAVACHSSDTEQQSKRRMWPVQHVARTLGSRARKPDPDASCSRTPQRDSCLPR
jgi:hypothetical protein